MLHHHDILHVDMDAFFVSVEELINPRLVGKAVVVGGSPSTRGVVAAASYEARKYGIHSAMPMAAALKRCPHVIRLDGNHSLYGDYSAKVMAIFERFTPDVAPVSVDEAYLDITGVIRLHKADPITIAHRIRDAVKEETGLSCSIGLAGSRVAAKIASDMAKPSGMLALFPGYDASFMAPLPVGKMPGVGPTAEESFRRMGITRIGDLARYDAGTLTTLFGRHGAAAARRAKGESAPLPPRGPVKSMGKEVTYAVDTDDPAYLEATLSYLSERVAYRLRQAGFLFRRVTVKIRFADFNTATRSRVLSGPSGEAARLFAVARVLLKGLAPSRRTGVRLVGVSVSLLTERTPQIPLFEAVATLKKEAVADAATLARERHGFEALLSARSLMYAAHRRTPPP